MFRRQSIIRRQHGKFPCQRQTPAQGVVGIEAAHHVAAAMEVQQHRARLVVRLRFGVQPRVEHMPVPRRKADRRHRQCTRRGGIEQLRRLFELLSGFARRQLMHGLAFAAEAAELGQLQKTFDVRVQCHGR
ncbi:hypothetical protein D3C78_1102860 [compost metagenome]